MSRDRTFLTIERRRDIFLAAVRIEEASILSSRRTDDGPTRPYSEDRHTFKDWQIEFYGCIPDGDRGILTAHYSRPLSETRNPKGNDLKQTIRTLWRAARKKRIIGHGLHIAETLNI